MDEFFFEASCWRHHGCRQLREYFFCALVLLFVCANMSITRKTSCHNSLQTRFVSIDNVSGAIVHILRPSRFLFEQSLAPQWITIGIVIKEAVCYMPPVSVIQSLFSLSLNIDQWASFLRRPIILSVFSKPNFSKLIFSKYLLTFPNGNFLTPKAIFLKF